ncbi:MAG: hypothetical protein PF542_01285 [Nanoarchaeota archaeon]|nr:hypothetical protein [Nanoarchaeota archaeon]
MKRLTNKFLDEVKGTVENRSQEELKIQLSKIEGIRNSKEIKDTINWSRHVGYILNKAMGVIPKDVLLQSSISSLNKNLHKIYNNNLSNSNYFRSYYSAIANSDKLWGGFYFGIVNHINTEKYGSGNFALGKDGVLRDGRFVGPINNGKIIRRFHCLNENENDSSQRYLKTYLNNLGINQDEFLEDISNNIINIAKKGRSDDLLVKKTLEELGVAPDDWISDKLKGWDFKNEK